MSPLFFFLSFLTNLVFEFYLNTVFCIPIFFFYFKYLHCTTFWPLRSHAVKYPPVSLGPFSILGSLSDVHDRVCSLKRNAVCPASPALVNEMVASIIFYCSFELFWYIINNMTK